jgi:hypothetical protein
MSPSFATSRTALGLAALLGAMELCGSADAQQSTLPACPADQNGRWHNCVFRDGSKYVGELRDGKPHGQGTYTFPSGEKYEGEWRDGIQSGRGTATFPNGASYRGEFRDGNRNGKGTYTYSTGEQYVGEWRDGKRNGSAAFTYSNGQQFVGQYRDDKAHGKGILYSATGSVLVIGIWANDAFVGSANATPPAVRETPSVTAAPPLPATPKTGSGSAFRIANGQFVTNHHVINGCTSLHVDGKPGGRVVVSDAIRDLALISAANDSGPIAGIRTTRIQLNESITAAGFPLEGAFSGIAITNGTVSRLSGLRGDTGEVQISAPVQPGNSGGPLLDAAGNVIGVVSSKLNALKMAGASGDIPQNVNFAINGSSLRAFLDAKNVTYKEVGNERELTGVQIAARASAFTVLIECRQ